jgi:hypothetical protein
METDVILFNDPINGYVSVVYPNLTCGLSFDEILSTTVPSGVEYMVLPKTMIPQNGILFDALTIKDGQFIIDTIRAEEIVKEGWRGKRQNILVRYDLLFIRALEMGDMVKTQDIANKKQILRDVTQTPIDKWIDGDTIETYSQRILNIIPECLTW